jgi:protease I
MPRIAIIVADDFEDSELRVPYDQLREAGHAVLLVGTEANQKLTGKQGTEAITTELAVADLRAEELDALVIPGGFSPDKLRTDPKMVALTRAVYMAGKPVAAICHAGSMLIEADICDNRVVTSWPSIKTDLINAGARWVDREVVEDGNLITSRKPDDLQAFCDAIRRQLAGEIPPRLRAPRPPEPQAEQRH